MTSYTKLLRFQHILGYTLKNLPIKSYSNERRLSYLVYKKVRQDIRSISCSQFEFVGLHSSAWMCKRRKTAEEKKSHRILEFPSKSKGEIVDVWRNITVGELAKVLDRDVRYVEDIFLNEVRGANTVISDIKQLQQGLKRSGHRMRIIAKPTDELEEIVEKDVFPRPPAPKSALRPRPPVVTVMGHVDHGKTTLLDSLRHSRVVDQEFGGITQHIGAFSVVLDTGARITFLDTPGHAAFTAMRARGASVTDIVVLVVAADDGVMEQTVESVRMAREANVPIVVAINKIDSPKANIERTEQMLATVGIQVENLGGDVQAISISALKKQNLDTLVEALVLQAEFLEIGADPSGPVEAVVVESKVDQQRGKLCTVVVQRGTLKKGDILVAGTSMAKVRLIKDAEGHVLEQVPPGYPAEIEGWRDLPSAGDQVLQVETEKRAREVTKVRSGLRQLEKQQEDSVVIEEKAAHHDKLYKEQLAKKRMMGRYKLKPTGPRKPEIQPDDDPTPTLNLVIKADVDGSLEALLNTFDTYDSPECRMDLVHCGVGVISETDVELAKTFNGIIYAFNVECPARIKDLAEAEGVTIKPHNVIYKLVDDIKAEINKLLPPKEVDEIIGEATVLQQFEINEGRKKVPVAGCRCSKGILRKSAMYKLVRGENVLHTGFLVSMRHLKNEVDTIKTDVECGLQLADREVTFQQGDTLICFQKKTVTQTTTWDPGF